MLSEKKKNVLEFNQYVESDKIPYVIYVDMEFLIKKIDECAIIQNILQQQKWVSIFLVDMSTI